MSRIPSWARESILTPFGGGPFFVGPLIVGPEPSILSLVSPFITPYRSNSGYIIESYLIQVYPKQSLTNSRQIPHLILKTSTKRTSLPNDTSKNLQRTMTSNPPLVSRPYFNRLQSTTMPPTSTENIKIELTLCANSISTPTSWGVYGSGWGLVYSLNWW